MPTYEYHCSKCKVSYELRQGFDAETTHACEECGRGVAKRVLHAPRVVFKGSGWYATDSRKSQSAVSESADSGASAGGDDSGDTTSTPSTESTPRPAAPKKSAAKDSGGGAEAAAAG